MPIVATAIALLAVAAGGRSEPAPPPAEVRRGQLLASLTVSASAGAKGEIVLGVQLRNETSQPQTFLLEKPGVEFFVKDARGAIVHSSAPCLPAGTCLTGLPEPTTLEPGAQMEFAERWRPSEGCSRAGRHVVKAKLRAYPARPSGRGDVGSFSPITLSREFLLLRDEENGTCVLRLAGPPLPR